MIKSGWSFRATSKRTRIETINFRWNCLNVAFFQSNIQENKDWNRICACISWSSACFQSNIQENKDWNQRKKGGVGSYLLLSEQHPREQGLKLMSCIARTHWVGELSEQHPREQGLKLVPAGAWVPRFQSAFRATSKRTRIETYIWHYELFQTVVLSEQHPREQGLKHVIHRRGCETAEPFRATSKRTRIETQGPETPDRSRKLSEQHPREQGLKPGLQILVLLQESHFQSNIQENKDWNLPPLGPNSRLPRSFRATSKRTRIETINAAGWGDYRRRCFQSNIQENKDWNARTQTVPWATHQPFRATSKRTRIETSLCHGALRAHWHLSEQHPREQGLKPRLHG